MRLYALLLLAYPHEIRERFGAGMIYAFEREREAARTRGIRAQLTFWAITLIETPWCGVAERLVGRPAPGHTRGQNMRTLLRTDWRDAWRSLCATPLVTVLAVLSLALGIGASTALFSILNSLLLKNLPVSQPERLVLLDGDSWSNPIWEEIRAHQAQIAESAFAWSTERFDLSASGESDLVDGIYASGGIFESLGVPALRGRTFTTADDVRGGGHEGGIAVVSYGFWQRRLSGAPDAIGRRLTIDRVPVTIVGIAPRGFFGPDVGRSADIILPLGTEALIRGKESSLDGRANWWLNVMLRLKPGQSVVQATEQLRALQPQMRRATMPPEFRTEDQPNYLREPFTLVPAASGRSTLRSRYEQPLTAMMFAVGLVLLIACANIANLLMARATARRHELGIRLALGASRPRLARQLLAESLMLALSGAAIGLVFAQWGSRTLVAQLTTLGSAVYLNLTLDWRVLGFTVAAAVVTAVLFGVAPALAVSRVAPNEALKEQGRTVAGEGRVGFRQALVVLQVALSLMLVVTASLFTTTLYSLSRRDSGFDRQGVLIATATVRRAPDERIGTFERLREAAASVPGVAGAAASFTTPLGRAGWNTRIVVPPGSSLGSRQRMSWINAVSADWFRTYGIHLSAGRDFRAADGAGAAKVAIVNRTFANRFLQAGNPVGQRVSDQGPAGEGSTYEVIGVVEDAVYRSLRAQMEPTLYLPIGQWDRPGASIEIGIRSEGAAPLALARSVATALQRVQPDTGLTFYSLAEQVNASLTQERILAALSAFFGGLALLLSSLGLYGVTSHFVSRRRTEIGIRMALGADASQVIRMVLLRIGGLVVIGIALGTAASLWASRFVATLLYGFKPWDPLPFAAAALVLTLVAAAAGWFPARRASRINPTILLRDG
jgi:putative ABC transport system permease protein